jgi:hypothetical protein
LAQLLVQFVAQLAPPVVQSLVLLLGLLQGHLASF